MCILVSLQMGYAKGGQDTAGIHFRLYSRAFIVADKNGARVCYVTIDAAMVSQAVKIEVGCDHLPQTLSLSLPVVCDNNRSLVS